MRITRVLGGSQGMDMVQDVAHWLDLRMGEGNERLVGDTGKVYARRVPGGTWIDPADNRAILKLEVEDD